jgi:UrcA family protein
MNSNVKTLNPSFVACLTAMWLACVLLVSNAHANDQVRSETVKFADLDLSTPAGAEALYGRIHAAARRVCDLSPAWPTVVNACMRKAESEAVGKVNAPLLIAYFEKKTGAHPQTLTAKR